MCVADSGYDNAQYAQPNYPQQQGYPTPAPQAYPAQNPYAANTTILRPPTSPYEARQSAYNGNTQDAYAAYEEPATAYPTNQYPSSARSPPPPLAPQPQRLQQMPDMEERSPSPDYGQGRAQDAGPVGDAPPVYEAGGSGYPPPQHQQRNEKAGYFN